MSQWILLEVVEESRLLVSLRQFFRYSVIEFAGLSTKFTGVSSTVCVAIVLRNLSAGSVISKSQDKFHLSIALFGKEV